MPSITHYQHLYISTLKHNGYSQHKPSNVFQKTILANNFRDPIWEQRPPRNLQIPPQFLIFKIFEIWDAITTCKWNDTNIPYCLCIFSHFHWTTNIVSIYYQLSPRMIHTHAHTAITIYVLDDTWVTLWGCIETYDSILG